MKKKKAIKEGEAEEPESPYPGPMKKTIRAFSSFEEAEEADAREMAALTPVQHLQNATAMIKLIFAEELKKKMDKKVYPKQGEDGYPAS